MNVMEAYEAWAKSQEPTLADGKPCLFEAFNAGWDAFAKSVVTVSNIPRTQSTVTAEQIYEAYPRKVGKADALRAIRKAMASPEVKESGDPGLYLLTFTKQYAACTANWPAADKQYIPYPATWFNRGSYDDNPQEWVKGAAAVPSQFSRSY